MNEFIISLIKYTFIFMCMLYAYTKLLRIKLNAWDLFDIPLFIALSAVLHFVTVYIKILVPAGFFIFGVVFLFLRFRKTFYETVTVGTIALGVSIITFAVGLILSFPMAFAFYFIQNEILKNIIAQLSMSIIQMAGIFLLFKIKRLRSGVIRKVKPQPLKFYYFSASVVFLYGCCLIPNMQLNQYTKLLCLLSRYSDYFLYCGGLSTLHTLTAKRLSNRTLNGWKIQ